MDTITTILARRSVRKYKTDSIPQEHLQQILEAGHQAPSAANRQPWHFCLVRDEEQKQRVAKACRGQMWMAQAAYILVGVGLVPKSPKWYQVDVAIAMENMILAAHSLGYGTCWIGAFEPEEVKEVCALPEEAEVVALTPIGVPDVSPDARARKEWDEVFSGDSYGQPLKP